METSSVKLPETRYALSGDVSIAYQVHGHGPIDLVVAPAWITNVELMWEEDAIAAYYRRLGEMARVIRFDKRGTGLSDRVAGIADMETRMDDVRAVMDAAGSERAAVMGLSEGGPLAALFAATYPERTLGLVLWGSAPRFSRAPGFPWGPTREEYMAEVEALVRRWGTIELAVEHAEGLGLTEDEAEYLARRMRLGASPGAVKQLELMNLEIDVRDVVSSIRVPTLVMHRTHDPNVPVDGGRWLAEHIPTARYVEFPGSAHGIYYDASTTDVEREIRDFLASLGREGTSPSESESVLATVLFTDIVGSTAKAAELGDRGWRELLEQHHSLLRGELARYRGREVDTAGDGFFAAFDGPARAIRCACVVSKSVGELGLEIRAGLHTGECELIGGKIGGIAVHIGARVAAEARPGEVLVSQTVRDLVAGSGLTFEERGAAKLRGVPGEWRLFAVSG
jgi:pimeloyl-ACP methyl ester carboxylesterase